ncbi:dienelactone hydrolase family protein [Sphingomonas rhizophila]|uniref:Dienelactone hydrolase family protein n=1 Tax=Sphingomonas rhizophila TaxID=2071607 RepID=A0A7G9S9Q2_9SPHN|nr:dienelactone hydrolase family protein [Sphingomonas rhizophila]QNN64577.1 dienelactone hydrolase family protein [Sphingomonas rhizophila]
MTTIDQVHGGKTLRHEWFAAEGARATILLFPTVMGVTDLERGFAATLNGKGWSVMIADLYGARFTPEDRPQASDAMAAIRSDRAAMRDLLTAVLAETPKGAPVVAIGFCFGGQCALDLARSGADIAGAASFHGLFDPPGLPPQPSKALVIAFHGWDDPLVTPDAVTALGQELTEAGCDWQIHAYGHVGHGFTNPGAKGAIPGIQFDEAASRRSWAAFDGFMGELFA